MKKELPVRLVDAQTVSHLRSQTIYHALAYAKKAASPDTIVLARPGDRYVCVGFHQDASQEVDLDYCQREDARHPAGNRRGTVLIDPDQLFVQWIFQPENLPRKMNTRFQLFVKPLIETYQFFGIKAYAFPPNDVHVNGKKIVGTGAAAIGNAEVVTGNFMLDFDSAAMADILKAPNAAFRDLFRQSLDSYLTNMRKELGKVPDLAALKRVYCEKCAESLGRALEPGEFTPEELDWMERPDRKFGTEEWLLDSRKAPSPGKGCQSARGGLDRRNKLPGWRQRDTDDHAHQRKPHRPHFPGRRFRTDPLLQAARAGKRTSKCGDEACGKCWKPLNSTRRNRQG